MGHTLGRGSVRHQGGTTTDSVTLRLASRIAWSLWVLAIAMIVLGRLRPAGYVMVSSGEDALFIDFPLRLSAQMPNPYVETFDPQEPVVLSASDSTTPPQAPRLQVMPREGGVFSLAYDLFAVDADGTKDLIATDVDRDGEYWSPLGRYLYFYARQDGYRSLFRYDTQSPDTRLLLYDGQITCRNDRCATLSYTHAGMGQRAEQSFGVMSLHNGTQLRILHTVPVDQLHIPIVHAWSTDERSLAYAVAAPDGAHTVYRHDLDTVQTTQLGTVPAGNADRIIWANWSYDDEWLLLSAKDATGTYDFYALPTDGSADPQHITANMQGDFLLLYPRWSPGEPVLTFPYTVGGAHNLYSITLPGAALQRRTQYTNAAYIDAWWSGDGRWLAMGARYGSNADCELRVFAASDGREVYRADFTHMTDVCPSYFHVRWVPWEHDTRN